MCTVIRMVIRRIEDFVAWQLATELEQQVYAFTSQLPAKMDGDFCRDIRRSASSAPRNRSEGFGRFWPTEFAPKIRIAKGELEETRDHLRKAIRLKYVNDDAGEGMITLASRAIGASTRFVRYLEINGDEWKKTHRDRTRSMTDPDLQERASGEPGSGT